MVTLAAHLGRILTDVLLLLQIDYFEKYHLETPENREVLKETSNNEERT
jgi:hypothetical protein